MSTYIKEGLDKLEKLQMTDAELLKFMHELKAGPHNYDSIVNACYLAICAAFKYVNDSPQGGITGFQASCLGWLCIKKFFGLGEESRARLQQMTDLLYPQYEYKFRTIDAETWAFLQSTAKKNLEETKHASPRVIEHWKSVAAGKIPFGLSLLEQ